jgi:hypothetical protein
MAFPKNGVVEAPKIVPSAFGLLAVVNGKPNFTQQLTTTTPTTLQLL